MKNFKHALVNTMPVLASYLFLGIAFGMLLVKEGYSPIFSLVCGLVIYAGSMQMALVPLLVSHAPLYLIGIMTLFINGRHMFYGISFLERFKRMGIKFPYMVYTTTDETYSVLCNIQYTEDVDPSQVDFYVHVICHVVWSLSCFLGSMLGGILPMGLEGIEFSATAFFVTVVVEQLRNAPSKVPFFIGLFSAIIFLFLLGPSKFIVPALAVSVIALMVAKDRIYLRRKA